MPINPKQARITLGLNQTEMAKAMGISRGLWLKWEREEQRITAAPQRLIEALLYLKSVNMLDSFLL
jgi:transcriptional regulator with XRE-family HTH domain